MAGTKKLPDYAVKYHVDGLSSRKALHIPGTGHWLAEQAPTQMIAALREFPAPYRDRGPAQ